MTTTEKIRQFVQTTLGCQCPEEVFRSVECRRRVRLGDDIVLHSAVIIGNRLLIYVIEADRADLIEKHLPFLMSAGKKERDAKGLNRFRLVLAAQNPKELRPPAERLFGDLKGGDEKVHLHVIDKTDVPFLDTV